MARNDSHLRFLDYLRGIAIGLVVLYHCFGVSSGVDQLRWNGWSRNFDEPLGFWLLLPASLGWAGVAIFFVVSGFCIHLSFERSRQKSISEFYLRRFFRIYPPYLVALFVFSFVYPWHAIYLDSFSSYAQFGTHLLLIQNVDPRSVFGINPSFWSIAMEFQLYLLYPALLFIAGKFGWKAALWITGIIEIGLRAGSGLWGIAYDGPLPAWLTGTPLFYWFSWSLGAYVAEAFLKEQKLSATKLPIFFWSALMLCFYFIKPLSAFCFPLAALATAQLITWLIYSKDCRFPDFPLSRFVRHPLRVVGVMSFSIYLIHQPILGLVPRALEKGLPSVHFQPVAIYILCLGACVLIALASWCFYTLLELPSIQAGKWLIQRARMAGALGSPTIGPTA
ncbi:MAG: acyltransferase [Terrimicrobiaceae bacterium]|nr:acyltransferase [Terrimicrobiaceae bacterium]